MSGHFLEWVAGSTALVVTIEDKAELELYQVKSERR